MGFVVASLVFGMVLAVLSIVAVVSSIGKPGAVLRPEVATGATVIVLAFLAGPAAMPAMGFHGPTVFVPVFWLVATNLHGLSRVLMNVGKVYPKKPRTGVRALAAVAYNLVDLAAVAVLLSVAL